MHSSLNPSFNLPLSQKLITETAETALRCADLEPDCLYLALAAAVVRPAVRPLAAASLGAAAAGRGYPGRGAYVEFHAPALAWRWTQNRHTVAQLLQVKVRWPFRAWQSCARPGTVRLASSKGRVPAQQGVPACVRLAHKLPGIVDIICLHFLHRLFHPMLPCICHLRYVDKTISLASPAPPHHQELASMEDRPAGARAVLGRYARLLLPLLVMDQRAGEVERLAAALGTHSMFITLFRG